MAIQTITPIIIHPVNIFKGSRWLAAALMQADLPLDGTKGLDYGRGLAALGILEFIKKNSSA